MQQLKRQEITEKLSCLFLLEQTMKISEEKILFDAVRSKAENGGLGVAEWLGRQLKESPHWLNPSRSAGVRQSPFSHTRPVRDCSMAELIAESWNKLK